MQFFGGWGRGGMKCIMGDMQVAYAVADPGEGPATPYPLSFKLRPEGEKNVFLETTPTPFSQGLADPPPRPPHPAP